MDGMDGCRWIGRRIDTCRSDGWVDRYGHYFHSRKPLLIRANITLSTILIAIVALFNER